MAATIRKVKVEQNYEIFAWRWMRYSAVILIPLVWIHVLIQDILVGAHHITMDYVVKRWSMVGWQAYDILLLGFAFAHGMNGLRQVMLDYVHDKPSRRVVEWVIFIAWIIITLIGGIAILAAAQKHMAAV